MTREKVTECIYNKVCVDPKTGKKFKRAIVCPEVEDGKNNCNHCGWNPKVEQERKERMGYTDIPETD